MNEKLAKKECSKQKKLAKVNTKSKEAYPVQEKRKANRRHEKKKHQTPHPRKNNKK
jgi:hypothetical protein